MSWWNFIKDFWLAQKFRKPHRGQINEDNIRWARARLSVLRGDNFADFEDWLKNAICNEIEMGIGYEQSPLPRYYGAQLLTRILKEIIEQTEEDIEIQEENLKLEK